MLVHKLPIKLWWSQEAWCLHYSNLLGRNIDYACLPLKVIRKIAANFL